MIVLRDILMFSFVFVVQFGAFQITGRQIHKSMGSSVIISFCGLSETVLFLNI